MDVVKRGSIWLVSLEPITKSEVGRIRPADIISYDINDEHAETVTVIPLHPSPSKYIPSK